MNENNIHVIGIICKNCKTKWQLQIPLTGNNVEVFAGICECGVLIVGNYNAKLNLGKRGKSKTKVEMKGVLDEKYLSNGSFQFLDLPENELKLLPILGLE